MKYLITLILIIFISGCSQTSTKNYSTNTASNQNIENSTNDNNQKNNIQAESSSDLSENTDINKIKKINNIPNEWEEYKNVDLGIRFIYPKYWSPKSENLRRFCPDFDYTEEEGYGEGNFDIGIFKNENKLSIEKWVNSNDFFELKQMEEPDTYAGHGLRANQPTIIKKDSLSIATYFGGASGGGSFGTAIFSIYDQIFVLAYAVSSYNKLEEKEKVFNEIVNSVDIIK